MSAKEVVGNGEEVMAISSIVKSVLGGATVIAVFYQLGFYSVVGALFFGSVSFTDHIIATLAIVPQSLVGFVFASFIGISLGRIQNKYEKSSSKGVRLISKVVDYSIGIMIVTLILFSSTWSELLSYSFLIFWYVWASKFLVNKFSKASKFILLTLYWGPAILFLSFWVGSTDAKSVLESSETNWSICWRVEHCEDVVLVKLYPSTILYILDENVISVSRSELVSVKGLRPDVEAEKPLNQIIKFVNGISETVEPMPEVEDSTSK